MENGQQLEDILFLGETSEQGIFTEIEEELGLNLRNQKIELFKTIKTDDDFVDIYYLKSNVDINEVKMQEEEVDDVKWATREEIENLIKEGKFSESHTEFFKYCLEYLTIQKYH